MERVREHVLTSLHLGRLRPGDRLVSVRRLADITGLNRKTVHRAYAVLVKEGLLHVRPGAGTFISTASDPHRSHDALMHAVNLCRGEANALGLSSSAFADFIQGALNGGLKGLPIVVVECNHEQAEMIGRDVRAGLGVNARVALLDELAADPGRTLSGAWGVVTTDCHRSEVESAVKTVGLPVYRVSLDPEFPQTILRWARSRGVVMVVDDDRFSRVFLRFLGQLGAAPEVLARVPRRAAGPRARCATRRGGTIPSSSFRPRPRRGGFQASRGSAAAIRALASGAGHPRRSPRGAGVRPRREAARARVTVTATPT
jgi:DNA-binding transcriptional regulator YhcF (GntR family)